MLFQDGEPGEGDGAGHAMNSTALKRVCKYNLFSELSGLSVSFFLYNTRHQRDRLGNVCSHYCVIIASYNLCLNMPVTGRSQRLSYSISEQPSKVVQVKLLPRTMAKQVSVRGKVSAFSLTVYSQHCFL